MRDGRSLVMMVAVLIPALLSLGCGSSSALSSKGSDVNSSDAGVASGTCAKSDDCEEGTVCSPTGDCVADCRTEGESCPASQPQCDQTSGLCGGGSTPPSSGADGGLPPQPPPQPPQTSCSEDEPCPTNTVCAPMGFCVPDCRIDNHQCPAAHPECNEQTGVCGGGADGSLPPPPNTDGGMPPQPPSCAGGAACPTDFVCSPMETCVPDCRVTSQCPTQLPVCDESTGLCLPNG